MLDETFTWVGRGFAFVILYIIISNTLWLLFGSRIVQFLPGVNVKGFRGTMKIATMIVLSAIGVFLWTVKYIFIMTVGKDQKPLLSEEISKSIKRGSKLMNRNKRLTNNGNH